MFIYLICSYSGKMFEIYGYGSVMEGQKVQAIYERPVFFFGTHSPPTRRIDQAGSLARISVLSENVRRACRFRERGPGVLMVSSWTTGNQSERLKLWQFLRRFWQGFWSLRFGSTLVSGKGSTYYLSWVLCFCCEIQSGFLVNVKEPKEMRILEVIVNIDFCFTYFFKR